MASEPQPFSLTGSPEASDTEASGGGNVLPGPLISLVPTVTPAFHLFPSF